MKANKKSIIAIAALLILIAAALIGHKLLSPAAHEGEKHITVEIFHGDGSAKTIGITTCNENLLGALEQESLISGDYSGIAFFVTAVDGEEANISNEEWWCITKGGEFLMTGVGDTMIADGDKYEFIFTVGYDQ